MPGMDGLQLLPALLRWKPSLRVLMLSAHTSEGATATVTALAAGAVDFIDKTAFNAMDLDFLKREVVDRLVALTQATGSSIEVFEQSESAAGPDAPAELRRCDLCVIGASTGGPAAVQRILQGLPAHFPLPVVVVQHMPPGFTEAFARRLNSLSRLHVTEAVEGQRLVPGDVVIAPGGRHLRVSQGMAVVLSPEPSAARHIPSVDVAMHSAARARPGRALGILLTGMGVDGAEGLATIRAGGGVTIAQSEASCVVYGMPRAGVRRRGATWVLSLEEIAGLLAGLDGKVPA
jgi:two-component system chemotaxis response regulator CheB